MVMGLADNNPRHFFLFDDLFEGVVEGVVSRDVAAPYCSEELSLR